MYVGFLFVVCVSLCVFGVCVFGLIFYERVQVLAATRRDRMGCMRQQTG